MGIGRPLPQSTLHSLCHICNSDLDAGAIHPDLGRMNSWAIYRYQSKGRMSYLGVVSAKDREEALAKAIRLLPEEDPGPYVRGRGRAVARRNSGRRKANASPMTSSKVQECEGAHGIIEHI
jgi:hypothetical protein